MTRKLLGTCLLLIWILQSPILYFTYQVKRWRCREEAELQANRQCRVEAVFFHAIGDVDWQKKEKEFRLDGVLYDVLSIIHTSEGVIITCHADMKETLIVQQYHRVMHGKFKDNIRDVPLKLPKVMKVPELVLHDICTDQQLPENCLFSHSFLPSPVLDILTPPPRHSGIPSQV